jgi:hypothetical protein
MICSMLAGDLVELRMLPVSRRDLLGEGLEERRARVDRLVDAVPEAHDRAPFLAASLSMM